MRFVLLLLFPFFSTSAQKGKVKNPKLPLYGTVVIIDPGHGGRDPGAHAIYKGTKVFENEYAYDVALRLQKAVRKAGGIPFLTITGEKSVRSPSTILVDDKGERFTRGGGVAVAGSRGLSNRIAFGNTIKARYPRHNVLWISLHFDVFGTNTRISGVRIITSDTGGKLTRALRNEFGRNSLLRPIAPVVKSGDRNYGIRRIFVLGKHNRNKEPVLIEMANLHNPGDLDKIKSAWGRERYAEIIVSAISKMKK